MNSQFTDSDENLLLLLKQDARKGFETLYNQQFTSVFYFARRIVSEQQAAEDITTETFLKLWQRLNDFNNVSAIRSFLYTTAKNACLNFLRDSRRHSAENEKIAYLLEQTDESIPAIEHLNAGIWHHIYNAIENLSPQLKKVFKMAYLEELSNEEIAETIGINNQSVRNDKVRALKQIRLSLLEKKFLSNFFFWATFLNLLKR